MSLIVNEMQVETCALDDENIRSKRCCPFTKGEHL